MLVRLAIETNRHHSQADGDRLSLMDVQTRSDYRAFLGRVFGFEAVIEATVARIHDLDPLLMRGFLKTPRLRQDLLALGASSQDVDLLPAATIPLIRTVPHALGWMFVLERHTLLAGLVRRHLARALPTEIETASSYLSAHGESPGARFRSFGNALATYGRRYPPDSIVTAAAEAFRAQRQWYLVAHSPMTVRRCHARDASS
jgi:heme oxygenase